jgi:hypothetical protein
VLEKNAGVFGSLVARMNTTFNKDSSDCLSTLSTTLEFLRLLMVMEAGDEDESIRTYTLTQGELHAVLSWKPTMADHPLMDLEKLLEVIISP